MRALPNRQKIARSTRTTGSVPSRLWENFTDHEVNELRAHVVSFTKSELQSIVWRLVDDLETARRYAGQYPGNGDNRWMRSPSQADRRNATYLGLPLGRIGEYNRLVRMPMNKWPVSLQEHVKKICNETRASIACVIAEWMKANVSLCPDCQTIYTLSGRVVHEERCPTGEQIK